MNESAQIVQLQQLVISLQKEKEELELLLQLKDEEMQELKSQPDSMPALYSKLQERLYDFEHLQQVIEKLRRELSSADNREVSMENQIIQSLSVEGLYDELKMKHRSVQASLTQVHMDLQESMELYQTLSAQQREIAEWKSKWELLHLENQFLIETVESNTSKTKIAST
jgi:hypothetical protein